jgi:hypothetical protein
MMPIHIGEGDLFLFSLLTQMLIYFRKTIIDALRNNILPVIWAFLSLVGYTHKNNHYRVINNVSPMMTSVQYLSEFQTTESEKFKQSLVDYLTYGERA